MRRSDCVGGGGNNRKRRTSAGRTVAKTTLMETRSEEEVEGGINWGSTGSYCSTSFILKLLFGIKTPVSKK